MSKDVRIVVILEARRGAGAKKFRKHCFKAKEFFHTTVGSKFIFTGTVKLIDLSSPIQTVLYENWQ
jgi:hypothetical protein